MGQRANTTVVPSVAGDVDLLVPQAETRPALRARVVRVGSLLPVLAKREYHVRYRQSLLDVGWSLLNPLATLAVYGFIFSVAFNVDGEGAPYLSFVWTGLVVWTLFSAGLGMGTTALLSNASLMSKIYFPREVLPLSSVGASLIEFAVSLMVLIVLAAVQLRSVSITAIGAVPAFALALVWTAGLAVFTAALTVFVRDVAQVVALFLRVAILATPVMYGPAVFPDSLQFLATWNPIAVAIEGARDAILFQQWPDWTLMGIQGVCGGAVLVLSIVYVRAVEGRMNDVI